MVVETKRELISRAEYARRKGVAARTIGKYCQRKIIPLHNNLIDSEEADRELAKILIKPLGAGQVSAKGKNGGKGIDNGISNGESSNGERLTNSYTEARTREKLVKVDGQDVRRLFISTYRTWAVAVWSPTKRGGSNYGGWNKR